MRLLLGMLTLACLGQAQEKLIVKENTIYTIASFDMVDYFSTLTREGVFLWEVPFSTKIVSVQESGDKLVILSRTRDGSAYFLTSVDIETGKTDWEKGIFAPRQTSLEPIEESSDLTEEQ